MATAVIVTRISSNYDLSEINEESIITKSDWNRIFEIKNDVNQSIEEMRNENQLKGSLDANVYIEANKNDIKILEKLGAELHFLFICSETNIIENNNFKGKGSGPGCISFFHGENHDAYKSEYHFLPKKGYMFIFPAYLRHYVPPFKSDVTRVSVSGNITLGF